MNLAKRLALLSAVPLVAFAVLGIILDLQFRAIEHRAEVVAELQLPSVVSIGKITRKHAEMRVDLRDYLLASGDDDRARELAEFRAAETELSQLLDQYAETLISDERDRRLMREFREMSGEWILESKKLMELMKSGQRRETLDHAFAVLPKLGERSHKVSGEWADHNERLAREANRATLTAASDARIKWWLGIALAAAFAAVLGYVTFRSIVVPLRSLRTSVKAIAAGDYAQDVPLTDAKDEIGSLARSVQVLKQSAEAMAEHRWVSGSAAALVAGLPRAATLEEFGRSLLSELVPIVGGGVAGFYVCDESSMQLRRVAGFGLADAKVGETFAVGEGLVGQCAHERRMLILNDLPPDYLPIKSGLGADKPQQSVAVPLIGKESLLGVLEIASFRAFGPRKHKLFDQVMPVVAMSLEILQRNLHTQNLLSQTQLQTRQLEEQWSSP